MTKTIACCCSDPGCRVAHGSDDCAKPAVQILCRVDMSDAYDLPMCDACTEDSMDSGVFDSKPLPRRNRN